jgi:hypothetical protein
MQYVQEAWDEWTPSTMQGPKTNVYLKTWPNRTTMQVFNILRSKLTYEAKLLKSRGAIPNLGTSVHDPFTTAR